MSRTHALLSSDCSNSHNPTLLPFTGIKSHIFHPESKLQSCQRGRWCTFTILLVSMVKEPHSETSRAHTSSRRHADVFSCSPGATGSHMTHSTRSENRKSFHTKSCSCDTSPSHDTSVTIRFSDRGCDVTMASPVCLSGSRLKRPVCPFTIKHSCDIATSSPSDLPTCACSPRELHARARVRRHTGCRTVAAGTRSWRVRTSRARAAAAAAVARPSRRSIRRQVKVWIPDQSAVPPAVSMEIHRKVFTKYVRPSRPIIRGPIQTHGPGRAAPPAPLRVPLWFTAPLVVGSDPVRSGQSSIRTSQLRQRRKRCDRLNPDQLLLLFITAPFPLPRPSRRSRGTRAAPRTHLMITSID